MFKLNSLMVIVSVLLVNLRSFMEYVATILNL